MGSIREQYVIVDGTLQSVRKVLQDPYLLVRSTDYVSAEGQEGVVCVYFVSDLVDLLIFVRSNREAGRQRRIPGRGKDDRFADFRVGMARHNFTTDLSRLIPARGPGVIVGSERCHGVSQ